MVWLYFFKSLGLIGASAVTLIFFSVVQIALIEWRNRMPEPYDGACRYALYSYPLIVPLFTWFIYGICLWTVLVPWLELRNFVSRDISRDFPPLHSGANFQAHTYINYEV